ncbi:HAD family hydrolase [Curtanaerobium respiraculi]|uniref:HAD family hydrolase n=1 Tax=Curtanaerobium respiraculi TaxID=2949669 RepID=UPI0024B37311|nr:HAD family hydrolase [Curtanaerobium respiraculi]
MNDIDPAPYDAIFFDMDGTLLPMPVRRFLETYYRELEGKLRREGRDAGLFLHALNRGMHSMSDHPSDLTNADAFWATFCATYEDQEMPLNLQQQAEARDFLMDFYANEFERCGEGIVPNPAANRAVQTLRAKGYPLYLTTMPLFPREGVLARLQWAAVDHTAFARITTFDNSTAVKPQTAFYHENLAIADALDEPGRVLMVGNNTIDDLSCLSTGMDAYLVLDELINENDFDIGSVKHGSLAEFAAWAQELPPCTSTRALRGYPNRSPLDGGFATASGREAKPVPLWDGHAGASPER